MDTKHTPGPWVINDTQRGTFAYQGDTENCIAEIYADVNEDQQANARLIAAAPDLLEALKVAERALNAMGDYINGLNAEEGISDEVNPAFESVREAIAKATTPNT